jgi:hypothetical protein
MYALLTLDVARDAVAEQFAYGEPLSTVVEAEELAPVAPRTRTALASALRYLADVVTPRDRVAAH